MTVQRTVVRQGDELPCHKQNIVHTEECSDSRKSLIVWYNVSERTDE